MGGGRYVPADLSRLPDDEVLDLLIWVSVDHGEMPGQWEKVMRLKTEAARRMSNVADRRKGDG